MKSSELLSEIALAFVSREPIEEQMAKALKTIGEYLKVSRVYVFLDSADGRTTSNAHEWCAPGVEAQKARFQAIPYASIPSLRRILLEKGHIRASDTSTLPEDLRGIIASQGISSILVYPLFSREKVIGFAGFDQCGKNREWEDIEVSLLKAASAILSNVCERRLGEERLKASEENFRHFFDTIDDLIIIGDLEGRILYTNDAVSRKLGFSGNELLDMHIIDLHPEDQRDEAAAILGAMFRGERESCPLELRSNDGGIVPVETRVWFGKWNGQDCIFGISKDLSKEQEALQKFTKIFERNPALMAISGVEDRVISDVNEAFLEKLGYSRAEVIGRTSAELGLFVDPEKRARVGEILAEQGSIRNLELKMRRKDGRVLDGLFSGDLIKSQGKTYFLTVMVDISEQIELRERLEAQGRRLGNIIEGARLGTWEWEVQTGRTIFNERWAGIVGYTLAELEPVSIATWEKLAHPDDLKESERLLEKHFSHETEFYDCENRMLHKDGSWVWVLDRGKVIEWDAEGKPVRMFGTHTDITEKKRLEERIREIAIRDPLTEIYNRRYIFERLEEMTQEYIRDGRKFCVAILDIDHFKLVNDSYGHLAGDFVLREFSSLIASSIRPYDLLGRYGGEEFIVVSANTESCEAASMIERVMKELRGKTFVHDEARIRFTFSCGIADSSEFPRDGLSIEKLVGRADSRLYAAKDAGRDRLIGPGCPA